MRVGSPSSEVRMRPGLPETTSCVSDAGMFSRAKLPALLDREFEPTLTIDRVPCALLRLCTSDSSAAPLMSAVSP